MLSGGLLTRNFNDRVAEGACGAPILEMTVSKPVQRLHPDESTSSVDGLAAEFIIPVTQVDRGDVSRSWTISTEWMKHAFDGTEASSTGKPGRLTVSVSRVGKEYVVRGLVQVEITLPCARTSDPAIYDISSELTLLLRRRSGPSPKVASRSERHRTRAQRQAEDEGPLSDEDAASDTFSGETIELDEFVREQVLLEFPMFPLRSDLRSAASAAIGPASQSGAAPAAGSEPLERQIDPRLAPLLEIANKLKKPSK